MSDNIASVIIILIIFGGGGTIGFLKWYVEARQKHKLELIREERQLAADQKAAATAQETADFARLQLTERQLGIGPDALERQIDQVARGHAATQPPPQDSPPNS